MTDWKRLLDIMKDNAGNAWELRIPRAGMVQADCHIMNRIGEHKDTGKVRPSHLSIKIKI